MPCTLCPRHCQVDRSSRRGFCGCSDSMRIARIGLHRFEEPCFSGSRGSGAIFFSGCTLRCIFCQNMVLQKGELGQDFSSEELAEAMLKLQAMGAHNINLVTPTPHTKGIIQSLTAAKKQGLTLPVLYNTNAYMEAATVKKLHSFIDLWLPDFKYKDPRLSKAFSGTENYPETALNAIDAMMESSGFMTLGKDGIAQKGVLIRHLVLPGCVYDTRALLQTVKERWGTKTPLSLMRQYTPMPALKAPLNRTLTQREYDSAVNTALDLGFSNVYIQEAASASFVYTPAFSDKVEIEP